MYARRAWSWTGANWARSVILGVALLTLSLAGCSLGSIGGGGSGSGPVVAGEQSLSALAWCDRPLISFQDDSQQSQQLTQWSAVKDQLGFTPYLPAVAARWLMPRSGRRHDSRPHLRRPPQHHLGAAQDRRDQLL